MASSQIPILREASGALGDLGTLLPLSLGAIGIAGLAPVPVLLGFAVFYIATGLYYRLPIPVQPMKVVTTVLLTSQLSAQSLAAGGVLIGAALLLLGCTGWINGLARSLPRSVLTGLQLGLGMLLATMSVGLMATSLLVGILTLLVLLLVPRMMPRLPAAPAGIFVAVVLGYPFDAPGLAVSGQDSGWFSLIGLPDFDDWRQGFSLITLPQLALTLTNAVVLTALIAEDYFGDQASRATPARLSISSGLANVFLTPFGALPMCHGAGGLAAHYRFGARSGRAPVLLGIGLILVALVPGGLALIAAIPTAGLGALLLLAAVELTFTHRLKTAKPSCWPVIGVAALVTALIDPFSGLLAGIVAEMIRAAWMRKHQAV